MERKDLGLVPSLGQHGQQRKDNYETAQYRAAECTNKPSNQPTGSKQSPIQDLIKYNPA
jgi:hypothetical protein